MQDADFTTEQEAVAFADGLFTHPVFDYAINLDENKLAQADASWSAALPRE